MEEKENTYCSKDVVDAIHGLNEDLGKRGVKIKAEDIESLKMEVRSSRTKVGLLTFLVFVLVCCCSYLCYDTYRKTNATEVVDSSHRLLTVSLEADIKQSDRSDPTQVKNALENGGCIRIKPTNEDIDYSFGTSYQYYGAANESGQFWTTGALLNYIASRGWTLVQAPSSGLTTDFYFMK